MYREQLFKEFQKETRSQINTLYIAIAVLLFSTIFFAYRAYEYDSAVTRIIQQDRIQLERLNEAYQLQIQCLKETYNFEDYECL